MTESNLWCNVTEHRGIKEEGESEERKEANKVGHTLVLCFLTVFAFLAAFQSFVDSQKVIFLYCFKP